MAHVALLRSVNVGIHNRVKMAALKEALIAQGLTGVETYLQSGNVLFEWAEDRREALEMCFPNAFAALDITSLAVIRSPEELAALVDLDPFRGVTDVPEGGKLVTFLTTPVEFALDRFSPKGDVEVLAQTATEICSILRPVDGRPPNINLLLGKTAAAGATSRNWAVTRELARLAVGR